MIVQSRNEKVSNHGSIPITIDCNVVAFIVFEEGFHQPIKRTKQSVFQDSLVYADKPQTLDHLEDNIRRVIADIRPQMLEKSSKIGRPDWTTSEPAVAVLCQKSYLKCNATRLSFE
ncbi:hypothetical protein TNCV_2016611 [Trichonephila clavipes]|nr:hypothetical protein TNCV_2016611 [Trichonephila clavipes]